MKRVATLLCAATIVGLPLAATAQAAEEATVVEQVQSEQVTDGTPSEELQNEDVKILTLGDVIQRAINNDQNLVVMQFELEALKNQALDVAYDKRDAQKDIRDFERKLDRLKDQRDRLKDPSQAADRIANGQQRIAINDALEALDDQITALENAMKQLESGQVQLKLQEEEVKEGITLKLTSTYSGLLSLQQQMDFTKKAIQTSKNDVKKAEKLYQYGAGSKDAVDQAKKEQINAEKQLEQQQKNYNHDLAALAFDINVNYTPDLQVTPVDIDVTAPSTGESYDSIIEGTFQMKRVKDSLELAKYNRDETYADEDASQYAKDQQDSKVKAAEQTIEKLHKELTTKIETLHHNEDTAFFNYEEAVRKLEDVKTDLTKLEKRYRFGIVPKHDYEKAKMQLEQSTLQVEITKMQYFMTQKSIEALNKGYI
ncbi:TolC family protein [Bacillus sp. V5-8f]|uniref:TolC family protein n=1 Tax=Bacillus sp. V5-8f TaxID=2053044 RepID=UPI0015E10431|nr:TolC family protein [Bacillus sp. V5-8f]